MTKRKPKRVNLTKIGGLIASLTGLAFSSATFALPGQAADRQVRLPALAQGLGTSLGVREWGDVNGQSRAIVVLVHGTTQHAASFDLLAQKLSACAFSIIAMDLRGHGRRFHNTDDGDPNRRVDYSKSADDLIALCAELKKAHAGVPIFCLGESVGSTVVLLAAGRDPQLCKGIILCSAGTKPGFYNPLLVIPDFVKGLFTLDKPMDVSRYIDRYSADDKRVSDEMIADPLARNQLTPKEILRTCFFIRRGQDLAELVPANMSVLVIQGARDRIVSTRSAKAVFNNLRSHDKKLVLLPEYGHVLLGTSFLKPRVVTSLEQWLASETAPTGDTLASVEAQRPQEHN